MSTTHTPDTLQSLPRLSLSPPHRPFPSPIPSLSISLSHDPTPPFHLISPPHLHIPQETGLSPTLPLQTIPFLSPFSHHHSFPSPIPFLLPISRPPHLHVLQANGLDLLPDVVPGGVVDQLPQEFERRVGAEGVRLREIQVVHEEHAPLAHGGTVNT